MTNKATENQDSDDLEALFDSIVTANAEPAVEEAVTEKPAQEAHPVSNDKVFNSVGQMTRALHDSLRELGLDKGLEKAASSIPDARDRLNYIAAMT